MAENTERELTCRKCGHKWTVKLADLPRPDTIIYRGTEKTRVEVFSVRCPECGHINSVEVTFWEIGDG
jgi:DNA-directed RNA polymerase subunit RPC12/RpoP